MRRALVVLAVWLAVFSVPGGPLAGATEEAPQRPAFRPTKVDLLGSYRPYRIHGIDWYESVGAARAKELRMHRPPGEERLLLQMRMLGPLDGAT